MGRVCAVPGCQSGRYGDRKKRKNLNLRQYSLFPIPKCDDKRQKWEKSLGCCLNANQFVCQLHFAESYIRRTDKTKLPDGTVHEIPRDYWCLEDDAIPRIQGNAAMDFEKNLDAAEQDVQENSEKNKNADFSIDIARENEAKKEIDEEPAPPIYIVPEDVSDDTKMNDSNENVFSMSILKEQLKGALLPESWAWTRTSSGVVFTLLDYRNYQPQLHLEVAFDLSLQIRTITDTVIPVHDHVESMEDICRYFIILKTRMICSGTGMERKSRDRRCIGILDDDDTYKRRPRNPRCTVCRNLRAKLQRNKSRRRDEMRTLSRT